MTTIPSEPAKLSAIWEMSAGIARAGDRTSGRTGPTRIGSETAVLEIGVFHNGASSLPVITTKDGVTLNDGSLAEVHRAAQETWSPWGSNTSLVRA